MAPSDVCPKSGHYPFRWRKVAQVGSKYNRCGMLSHFSHVWLSVTLWPVDLQAPLSWDSWGKNTGVGCHGLLQGIFPTQGSNPSLLYYRQIFFFFFYHWAPVEAQYNGYCSLKRKCNAIQRFQRAVSGAWNWVAATVASTVSIGLFGDGTLPQKLLTKYLTPVLGLTAAWKVTASPQEQWTQSRRKLSQTSKR